MGEKRKRLLLEELARRVRARRYELGFTQEQLAEKADFHVNFIGGIERAIRNPSFTSLVFLAEALEMSPRDLVTD